MSYDKLRELGWKPFFEQQITQEDSSDSVIARVSTHHGSQILMLGLDGEFAIAAQLAEPVGDVTVGDWLILDAGTHRARRRLERHTLLYRKAAGKEVKPQLIAANIDTIFIVSSCNEDFNLSRIERYLALSLQAEINPVVVLTKADLNDRAVECRRETERLHPGLLVETLDARDTEQASVLNDWCGPGQTVALVGSSGVGKSTLANTLGVGSLATGAIREHDGKGRHTTTSRSLHLLDSGGVLIDNPGIRELQLPACEDGIADLFEDVYEIAKRCKFRNCNHKGDVGCALAAAIESGELEQRRFVSFMKLRSEQARNSQSLAERNQRERATGKLYKSIIAAKKKRREQH